MVSEQGCSDNFNYRRNPLGARHQRIGAAALVFLLASLGEARAQNIDFGRLIGGVLQGAIEAQGRRLPDERRRHSEERLNEAAPGPIDDWHATRRLESAPKPEARIQAVIEPSPYVVEGNRVGARVDFSGGNGDFRCSQSEAFPGLTWCQRRKENPGGAGSSSSSILHTADGVVRYANRFIDAATFSPGEVDGQIARLSRNYREQARVLTLTPSAGLPGAVIATWGKVQLVPLDSVSLQTLAGGGGLKAGLLIDYLGDFRRSARLGQPVYRITGGPGYIWAASYANDGRGTLRLTAADLSGLGPVTPKADAPTASAGAPATMARNTFPAASPVGDIAADKALTAESQPPVARSLAQAEEMPTFAKAATSAGAPETGTPSIQIVVAQGMGTDVESATKNAAENALTQVVGSFINTEKMLEKRSQIVDGIRSETRSLRAEIREYSQGSIKALEVLDTTREANLYRVQARVAVRVEDFKAYIKKVAMGETAMGAGLFAQIATARNQQQNLESILRDKIVSPIAAGEVVRIRVGSPVPLANSDLTQQLAKVGSFGRTIAQMNRVLTVVFPIEVSLDDAFGQSLVQTLESTASDKLRQQESPPLGQMCQMMREGNGAGRFGERKVNVVSQSDTGVKLLASTSLMTSNGGRENTITETYKLSDVRLPNKGRAAPKLDFQIISRDGSVLWERFFSQNSLADSKAVIVSDIGYGSTFLPWTLVHEEGGCVFIARTSKFSIVAEMDPDTLKTAERATLKFAP